MDHKTVQKVFFIAPLPIMDRAAPRFLAAHKKIFFILDVMHSLRCEIVFINSAPAMGAHAPPRFMGLKLKNGSIVSALIPATNENRQCGRLRNIQQSTKLIKLASEKYGKPDIVWCYNGYAFEMRAALYANKKWQSRIILEFEDWHFSRRPRHDPKAILDWFFWRRALNSISYCYAVNSYLRDKILGYGIDCELLPGVVEKKIISLLETNPPFSEPGKPHVVRCGYFGGLSIQKGAGRVLELVQLSIEKNLPIEWVVSGSGELGPRLRSLSKKYPQKLKFHGMVSEQEFPALLGSVDMILNPHDPMPGVFPFKVLESVASGRLVLSNVLEIPEDLSWLRAAILVDPYHAERWIELIVNSRAVYANKRQNIHSGRDIAISTMGAKGFGDNFRRRLECDWRVR